MLFLVRTPSTKDTFLLMLLKEIFGSIDLNVAKLKLDLDQSVLYFGVSLNSVDERSRSKVGDPYHIIRVHNSIISNNNL